MQLRVLGCHGGESTIHRTASFLIDDHLLIDAGAVTRGLTIDAQKEIDDVIVSHAHIDHIRDLPLLCDNIIGERTSPLRVHCTKPTAEALRTHIFNDTIWPDFTAITNPSDVECRPVLEIVEFKPEADAKISGFHVKAIPVNHPVDTHSIFLRNDSGTLCYSSDTGITEAFWVELNARNDLRALIYEVSFPNEMEEVASASGHLTPQQIATELAEKFRPKTPCPILIYHLKPSYFEILKHQIEALNDSRLVILQPMDEFVF